MPEIFQVKMYGENEIRSMWDEEQNKWLYSVIDVINALGVSRNASRYWSDCKRKWMESEKKRTLIHTKIVSMKLQSKDGKRHQSDMLDIQSIQLMLPYLRTTKAESFQIWLQEEDNSRTHNLEGNKNISHIRPVLPLLNSSFDPGQAQNTVDSFEDPKLQKIAQSELYYFSGKAKECSEIAELFIMDQDLSVRLSACILYAFSNLTLGNAKGSKASFEIIRECGNIVFLKDSSMELKGVCVFINNLSSILLHIPADQLLPLQEYMKYLPIGLRCYAIYAIAHEAYLKEDYERGLGLAQAAVLSLERMYPVCTIYLDCISAMCLINLKRAREAKEVLERAWKIARADELIEPFIEHHGLLQGLLESCIKVQEPDTYKRLSQAVVAFSRGWMQIHNAYSSQKVTDELTPLEYSIAMLACRNWTNQEIADYIGMSPNTIKHHISNILTKLNVGRREDIKDYVNL